MNGARYVHDELVRYGWEVLVADAVRVKGAGATGVQDRQGRRARAGAAVVSGSGAGDLATNPGTARRARALTLAPASGQAPRDPQEPRALLADRLRPSGADGRPVRRRRPAAAGQPGLPRAVAGAREGQPLS